MRFMYLLRFQAASDNVRICMASHVSRPSVRLKNSGRLFLTAPAHQSCQSPDAHNLLRVSSHLFSSTDDEFRILAPFSSQASSFRSEERARVRMYRKFVQSPCWRRTPKIDFSSSEPLSSTNRTLPALSLSISSSPLSPCGPLSSPSST